MNPLKRRSVVVGLVLGLTSIAGAAIAGTESSSGDNHVILLNQQDGRTLARAGFSTKHELGDVVDNQNAAVAVSAGCTGCRTVATAVQVVLVESNAHTVVPQNLAIALNQSCTGCESMASAYQYVLTTNGIVHFTAAGEQEMSQIRQRISDLTNSSLAFADLKAQLDTQVHDLWGVVDTQLVHAGVAFEGSPTRRIDIESTPAATTFACESPAPSVSVAASPSPCPSESAGPTQSPIDTSTSPTPSATEAPSPASCPSDTSGPSPAPTATESPSASPSPCPSDSPTASPTDSPSPPPSAPDPSPVPTDSASATPSPSGA